MSNNTIVTYGEKSVGFGSKATGAMIEQINDVKNDIAAIINKVDKMRNECRSESNPGEKIALFTIGIRELQTAAMRISQAITWVSDDALPG